MAEGFLYTNSEGVKSNCSVELKYGAFVWRDDLSGAVKGQVLFEHVARVVPGLLLKGEGEGEMVEASDVEMTMVCHDGLEVVLRADDEVEAGEVRAEKVHLSHSKRAHTNNSS